MRVLLLALAFTLAAPAPRIYRLHVVNGFPRDADVTAGYWINVHANLAILPPRAKFSHWLLRRDVAVDCATCPDTVIQMPDRPTEIGWTWWTPN